MAGTGSGTVTQDISPEVIETDLARTAGGDLVAIAPVEPSYRNADVLVIEARDGTRYLARYVGRTGQPMGPVVEGRAVAAYTVASIGQPVRELTGQPTGCGGEGHEWGSLGLPNGLDTTVVPVSHQHTPDDLGAARASRGAVELEDHPTLSLAPGDRLKVGEAIGTITAIDRRARTVEIETGNGSASISLNAVESDSNKEQPQ